MKYIEGFCFFPHFYFHSVESVNARAMILIIDLSGEKEEKGKRKKGRRRERERNRKSRFAPMKMQRSTAGAAMICNLFFFCQPPRIYRGKDTGLGLAFPLRINTIPITSGVRFSRIRVPWQLATYLLSSFSSLFFFFILFHRNKNIHISSRRKYGVLKKNNEKEDGKGKDGSTRPLSLINVISITPWTSRGVFEIAVAHDFLPFLFPPFIPLPPRVD